MVDVFVTGVGIISALGKNTEENRNQLRLGKTGIDKATFFQSKYTSELLFGEVKQSNIELAKSVDEVNNNSLSRTDLLALEAFSQAVADAALTDKEISSIDTSFISASTVGGMCYTDELYQDANLILPCSNYLNTYSGSAHALNIIKKYNIKGYTNTINTACSSSANAIMMGTQLIHTGRAKRVIVGGADALAKFTVNGFNSLRILSETKCKPFDENRSGLNLGEGAAYLVLESSEIVKNKPVLAKISGYGNTCDAHHASSLSEDATGIIKCINKALDKANLQPQEIDYINAHGTGTENNDIVELTGITKIFEEIPPFNSTKSYTGHTLGAAGAIEAVFSIFSIVYNELYQSLQHEKNIAPMNVAPLKQYLDAKNINHVLSNSFGFNGNCTSLVISKAN